MPNLEYLSAAAERWGLDPDVLKFWCRSKRLRYTRIGHQWLVDPEDLAEYIRAHVVEPDESRLPADRCVGAADAGR